MKKTLLILISIIGACSSYSQISLKLRDTRFASIQYTFNNHWIFQLEESLNSGDEQYQNIRFYTGYQYDYKKLSFQAIPYAGVEWAGDYWFVGTHLNVEYRPLEHLVLTGTYNPHWDSVYGYTNCFMVGTYIPITDEIALVARYQTIPEYRIADKRVRAGVRFKVKNLTVTPELSISPNKTMKPIRVMVGLNYTFRK